MAKTKQIKTGTKVRLNPKWDKISFHQSAGVGTVVGKFFDNYTVNFGKSQNRYGDWTPYDVVVPAKYLIIVTSTPRGYRHPMSPTLAKVERFTENLHGSGINYKWNIEETPSTFRASNAFDVMNEAGFDIGGADFTVVFPKGESMGEFRLEFNGNFAQKLNQRYMLRDYLQDTIAYTLDNLKLR